MKQEIKNIELLPMLNNLLIDNKDWTVPDAIHDLANTYNIHLKRYHAIASAYSRWKQQNNKFEIKNIHTLIKYISTENVVDFLEKYQDDDEDYEYILNRFKNKKGAADSRKVVKIIRAMLLEAIK